MPKKILLLLLLFSLSSISMAKVGDSYLCEMGSHISNYVRPDMPPVNEKLETFTLKRHEDSVTLRPLFGGTMTGNFVTHESYGSESFSAEGINLIMTYHNGYGDGDESDTGLFNLVLLYIPVGFQAIGAMCQKIQ